MPSARSKALLLTFVAAWTKVRRMAGRDPPILFLFLNKNKPNRLTICWAEITEKNQLHNQLERNKTGGKIKAHPYQAGKNP